MAGPHQTYTEEEVTHALLTLIACAGNVEGTVRRLADEGLQLHATTLRRWRNEQYVELYRRLEQDYGDDMEDRIVQIVRSNAERAAQAVADTLDFVVKDILTTKERNPKDTANAVLALNKVAAGSVDKVLALTGRPQSITATINPEKLLESMVSRGFVQLAPAFDAEGEAQEIAPADGNE